MTHNRVFATICCSNYLAKASALARSLRRHHAESKIAICIVDKALPEDSDLLLDFDFVYLAKDVIGERFDWLNFKYSQLESSTFVKATFLWKILCHADEVVYLDPDIVVYSPLYELDEVSREHSIILTPHHLLPTNDMSIIDSSVIGFMMCGVYNLGFICLRRSEETFKFLDWWNHKLEYYAYLDFSRGLFTDQRWLDIAVVLFQVHVLRFPGFNVANWNLNERVLKPDFTLQFDSKSYPIRFVHFSGSDYGKDLRLSRILANPECREVFAGLRLAYHELLARTGHVSLSRMRWTYDDFDSGEPIRAESKTVFLRNRELREATPHPYAMSNEYFQEKGY